MTHRMFKTGDRVRLVKTAGFKEDVGVKVGMVGTVLEDSSVPYVKIDGWHCTTPGYVAHLAFSSDHLELLSEEQAQQQAPKFKVGDTGLTPGGSPYRIVKTDHTKVWKGHSYPIIAAIGNETDDDAFRTFTDDGAYCVGDACDWDLLPPSQPASEVVDAEFPSPDALPREIQVGDRVRLKIGLLDAPAGSVGTVVPKQRETMFPSLLVDIDGFTNGHNGGYLSDGAGSKLYIQPEYLERITGDSIPELSAAYRAAHAAHAAAVERTLTARFAYGEAEAAEGDAEVAEQQAAAALLAAIDAA